MAKFTAQPHCDRELSLQSYPAILSQRHTPSPLSLSLNDLLHQNIDHNSRSHLPNDNISRNTQTELTAKDSFPPKQTYKVWKRNPIAQMYRYLCKEPTIMKSQVNMTQPKETMCSEAQWCLTLQPHGPQPSRLLCPWDSPGENNGVGCHFLFQGIFSIQWSNPCFFCLLHWQVDSSSLMPPGKPTKWD